LKCGQGCVRGEKAGTERFLNSLERYPVDEVIAKQAADYYQAFAKQGVTLHIADLIIAATAVEHRLTLVSYNPKHFPMEDIHIYTPMPKF
jgi:hypothetical protein